MRPVRTGTLYGGFLLLLLAPTFVSHAQSSLSLSLPQGFEFSYEQTFEESRWSMRGSIGGWPIERSWPRSLKTSTDLGDSYALDFAPRIYTLTSSLKAHFRPSLESTWTYQMGLELWTIQGGAFAYLRNQASSESVLVADLQARWWQPVLSASANWTLSRRSTATWILELGLAIPVGGSFMTRLEGPLPALQGVAPEYAEALQDGTRAAEQNLSQAIGDALSILPILPTLGLRYSW